MSRIDWMKQGLLTAGMTALLACGAFAAPDQERPKPIPQPPPPNSTKADNDLTVERPLGNLMLKNADQINLLNSMATIDISVWSSLLKRNHPILNDEFTLVMSNRSQDAMRKAISSYAQGQKAEAAYQRALAANDRDRAIQFRDERERAEKARNGYVEISFRYALLADLTAGELHKDRIYRYELAKAYAKTDGGAPMALALVGNILVTEPGNLPARLLSGQIRERGGDIYGAMVDYQWVVKRDSNNALAWTAIAKAHLVVSDFVKAKDALHKAVACTNGGSTDEARKLLYNLENPQQLPPASDPNMLPGSAPNSAETADSIASASEALLRENRVEEARKGFTRALQLETTNARAHMGLGDIFFRCSEFMKAIDEYNLAARYAPSNALPLRYMGLACEKVYDTTHAPVYLERAIECIASAIRIKADFPEARADQERLLTKKTNDPAH